MFSNIKEYKRWFFFVLMLTGASLTADANDIIIKGKIPVYIQPGESAEVRVAVEDLLRDLQSVFGQKSIIINHLPKSGSAIVIATGNRFKGKQPALKGWESHQVYVDHNTVVLNGADIRGTIYAIYTFSELLGVKPLWFWASAPPKRINNLHLNDDFIKVFNSPDIKYRTWLPNDTDFLSPWQERSQENYEAIFEAMLRLKLNTIEGTIADENSFDPSFKLGKQAQAAKRRGLVNTGHHMQIFGSNYSNWPQYWKNVRHQSVPELTIANRNALAEYWGYHIDLAMKNNAEVIWLVGFRGNRDIPFWEFFPDSPKDARGRARVIGEMVQLQIDLLKKKTKDPHPPMRLTLYNEMTTLLAQGLLQIPNEPSLIRNFVAARRDHFPAQDIFKHEFSANEPTGYYMNFQFTSTGSHLAQAEGPRKMEQNYRTVDSLSKGQLMFSVVNAGNVREHLLELSANADMMWDFKKFNPKTFLNNFSATYFGAALAPEISDLYTDFFNAYWEQKKGDIPGFERQYIFQDLRYARSAEMIISDLEKGKFSLNPLENHPMDNPDKGSVGYFRVMPIDNGTSSQLEAILKGTGASMSKLEKITAKADTLYDSHLNGGKIFFNDNLRGQAYIMLHLNKMLNNLARCYQTEEDQKTKKDFLKQGLQELRMVKRQLHDAEHSPFEGWYANEKKFGIDEIEKRINVLLQKPVL
ncbi:hypothetical protein EZ449_15655 [Pedobacter frigidisoli]|uniref:Glycosyl hydrolase family 115 n=1 Tax=Pedobacter frigidisoli TaxID=2530455 RepID=A0A4R0P2F3_9SPHI|nr:glycosyl hydrolase 115 family protein [Pedobacter frigidisoli]TCD05894.1 hypothetical protein EZ449_15655 [Pedobacter frigidisoli]